MIDTRGPVRTTRSTPPRRGGAIGVIAKVITWSGKGIPTPSGSLAKLVVAPYFLIRIILFLIVVWLALPLIVVMLLVKVLLFLPRTIVAAVTSRTTVTGGTHLAPPGLDDPFASTQLSAERAGALAAITSRDPGHHAVFDRAEALWEQWHRSIVAGDAALVRPIMTEGMWRLHRMLLEVRAAGGVERVFDARVVDVSAIGATHSAIVDEVVLCLHCEGTCFDRHYDTAAVLRGSDAPEAWTEELTMRRSALTADHDAIDTVEPRVASTCPNCGAPLAVDQDGTCCTCAALVAGSPGDWVLCSDWRAQW